MRVNNSVASLANRQPRCGHAYRPPMKDGWPCLHACLHAAPHHACRGFIDYVIDEYDVSILPHFDFALCQKNQAENRRNAVRDPFA